MDNWFSFKKIFRLFSNFAHDILKRCLFTIDELQPLKFPVLENFDEKMQPLN